MATENTQKQTEPEYITDEDVGLPGPTHALTVMPPPAALAVSRPPAVVLEEAREAATALVGVIKSSPGLSNRIDGHDYLKFEAWQTIGKFYGATVRVMETKYLEYGEVKGFEAKAVILNSSGLEISGAEAMCLNDERNWKSKPLYQLKSMAQTRASAKALRNVFAWVVVLAGYKPTPAEEMDGVKPRQDKPAESTERHEGILKNPTMSSGSLFFKIGEEVFYLPPMRSQDLKATLKEADGAFVELMARKDKTGRGRDCWLVTEVLKYEPAVPF